MRVVRIFSAKQSTLDACPADAGGLTVSQIYRAAQGLC